MFNIHVEFMDGIVEEFLGNFVLEGSFISFSLGYSDLYRW